ncbi:hypothetical protein ABIB40_002231 [Pedobacter sp. UYP30]|uniref:MutS-related protein n=1 Tax=Pedobacter sp. UYP30 TaxID=1756400 RepID=UPI003393D9B0
MLATEDNHLSLYQHKTTDITQTIAALKKQIDRLSLIRVALFLLEILFLVLLVQTKEGAERLAMIVAMFLPIAGFVVIVKKQSALDKEIVFQTNLLWVYQNEVNLTQGKELAESGKNGYDHGEMFKDNSHPYSSDLDIFGDYSLFAMVNRASTKFGNTLIAQTLAKSSATSIILERQSAIAELVDKIEPTFEFRATLRGQDQEKRVLIEQKLNGQLATELAFTRSAFLRFYVAAVPYISLFLIGCAIILGGPFIPALIVYAIAHFVYNSQIAKKASNVFDKLAGTADLLDSSSKSIAYTEDDDWKSDYIKGLFQNQEKVSMQIKKLATIIQAFDARLNFLVGGILNVFLLWDIRCSIRLDKWQNHSSTDIIAALNRIGHFEELISFAMFSYNHSGYIFPHIEDNYSFSTRELGHPLIPIQTRVYNDFEFAQTPTVDIVTGSNMAGKSTFLRTVGINMVLAYAGSVVCAERLSLSIFSLVSYMRIADSLNESTSTFKAELIRLKMILEHVQTQDNGFVLIDEMLRGTNSQDKYTGSKVFIEKLLSLGKPALFATHDLQLSSLAETHPRQVRNFNFDIQINDGQMHFDYKIKEGSCKTFNAAILLREIGLGID